ncbi:ATP-binding protein [Streptomyces sp. B93]|uniref:ATP-binding protein n=1 Tax=Streptomyces sp. B93 TaxID=2824875 RepID=UPI001B3892FB|nr:ATP-binding protein [Streptomyces sp. B93]MBQ1092444.1 ATP-binding protein [Streptomyces sp. B93]
MDPNTRGPEDHGQDGRGTSQSSEFDTGGGHAPRQRPPRDPLATDFAQHAPALARTVRLVTGELLLTVNPVDGSEIEPCPPTERPERPRKLTAAQRAEADRAARPPGPAGPARPGLPLLGRQDEREQLVRLLARGRSVRLTGPAGSGRSRLLDLVADDCADLAPDGVVRLSGFHRTTADLLHDLFYAVHDAPHHRPEPDELLALVREIGAVVVVDDLEAGGTALDELLDATPECAFLFAATPDVPAPSADADIEEVTLPGLDRAGGLELLELAVGRPLTEEEANWAGDLWFESEGLPLRFVQAGALLRQLDRLRAGADAIDEFGVFEDAPPVDAPVDGSSVSAPTGADDIPLPSLAEGAAPAELLASRLSGSARDTLRFAVALGGEVPHQAHLPALVGDTHADAALGELLDCALVSPVGPRYRLAAGVRTQLEAAGYADDIEDRARTAAQHYGWWAGHPSVTPERVCAEADAVLAALAVLVPVTTPPAEDEESTTVQLARAAAPAFAAGLHWTAWERALRSGAEASRLAGQVAEQAYFHHELGVLALCEGRLERARAELEAAIGLRGALSDKRGTVSGRRALALVTDRSGLPPALGPAGEEVPAAPHEESAPPPAALGAFPPLKRPADTGTLVTRQSAADPGPDRHSRGGLRGLAKRNLVAAGAGALLAAVLGTVVTLGATSSNDADNPSDQVGGGPSASQGTDDGSLGAEEAGQDTDSDTGTATSRASEPGPDGTPGTSDDPAPTHSGGTTPTEPSDAPSGTQGTGTGRPSDSPTKSPSKPPSTSTKPPTTPTTPPTETEEPTTPPPDPEPSDSETPPETPITSDSASGPVETTASASEDGEAGAPDTEEPVM